MELGEALAEIEKRFEPLSVDDKLLVIERLVRRVRHAERFDPAETERQLAEFAADEELLRRIGMANPVPPRAAPTDGE
jgi:hypothetical protein